MSKMNAIRIINLNYNNNAIHVDDETFRFDGESTLMSLRNGGGKSVMVQMMIAPFVHKRYRNTEDRPFASFFTTNKPTFILVEWALDSDAGYVLTGMMVRKATTIDNNSDEELEIVNVIGEYKERCRYDINNLAVIETTEKSKTLKTYGYCKQLFEDLKKDSRGEFNYYDMNNSHQSKRYFDRLKEYKINHKEWEDIIKKVNLKESGLSDLFATAKDEKGLIEKWFIDTVESKLNKEKSRIKESESLVEKYILQYRENRSKIERKEVINKFREEAVEIENIALGYKRYTDEQTRCENQIANLVVMFNKLLEENKMERIDTENFIEDYNNKINQISYEELSYDIYNLEDKRDGLVYELGSTQAICDKANDEMNAMEKRINIYECARLHGKYKDASKELQFYENKLEIKKSEASNLEPERNMLGYNLRRRYEEQKEILSNHINLLMNHMKDNEKELDSLSVKEQEWKDKSIAASIELGKINEKIESYNSNEDKYNKRYNDNLMRNILGEYEDAILEVKLTAYKDNKITDNRERKEKQKHKEELDEKMRILTRDLEDAQSSKSKSEALIDNIRKDIDNYNEELEERKIMIRYLGLEEKDIFDTSKIIDGCNYKIQEVDMGLERLSKEYSTIEKEYNRLKQGNVIELPKNFIGYLESLDIQYMYGMDWLKKNDKSIQDNERLVDNNPFIPYSIILSMDDVEKLKFEKSDLYTSWPIPIIKREELERLYERNETQLEGVDKVSFFVMFNKNLLDADKLSVLIIEKEAELEKKQRQISIRKEEQDSYFEKRERLKNQKVDKELYSRANILLEESIKEKSALETKIEVIKDSQLKSKKDYDKTLEDINQLEKDIIKISEQIEELEELSSKYKEYVQHKSTLLQIEQRIVEINSTLKDIVSRQNQLRINNAASHEERTEKQGNLKIIDAEVNKYLHYDVTEISNKDIEDLEARYKAITDNISVEQQTIEENLKKAKKIFNECEVDLLKKAAKYNLEEEEYTILYDEFQESKVEDELKQKIISKKKIDKKIIALDKEIGILEANINTEYKQLKERCNQLEPVERKKIIDTQFKMRIIEQQEQRKKEEKKLSIINGRIQKYNQSLTTLSQYEHLKITENVDFSEDFNNMSDKEFREYNGIVLRDYRETIDEKIKTQGKLRDTLSTVARIEEFADEYYMKRIEMLISLIDDANSLLEQLYLTLDIYQTLMEKLEIDIANIDKEKAKVIELILDYIQDVHMELGKIDKNSSINIRGRSVKMLKLTLPIWEENESSYAIRMRDYIEELTKQSLAAMDNNENVNELIGKRITTKNLYDEVVGISNIGIRLYKIEEQREYPITWADVSKNSGGEGFLSAFVILSSLLYYMRRDETDIFAEKEEGKVLVMDNPFAQTNSSHLLKPLMDIAKKTNTQLICLTGLGGESIYNRFDNIYVLNLISSSLRRGMEYMKSERIKGSEDEAEEMVLARVLIENDVEETYEQATLF